MSRIRSMCLAMAVAAAVLALAACNPLPSQPTTPRADGRSRSGFVHYEGPSGWLEVAVSAAPVDDVSFDVFGVDMTRPRRDDGQEGYCRFATAPMDGWRDGASLGYQRVDRIGPGTYFTVQFPVAVDGLRFDVRVVDDEGNPIGDLVHDLPRGGFEAVASPIC